MRPARLAHGTRSATASVTMWLTATPNGAVRGACDATEPSSGTPIVMPSTHIVPQASLSPHQLCTGGGFCSGRPNYHVLRRQTGVIDPDPDISMTFLIPILISAREPGAALRSLERVEGRAAGSCDGGTIFLHASCPAVQVISDVMILECKPQPPPVPRWLGVSVLGWAMSV
jgi:hypothetical protein